MPRDPHKLEVFRLAHQLAIEVYRATNSLPSEERFGLQSQLRRAAVSVPANLVEGCARRSLRDYQRFVEVALGSAVEVRYLLDLTDDLGLVSTVALAPSRRCSEHVVRALHNLQQAIGALPG
jgi:four helix bundle protein